MVNTTKKDFYEIAENWYQRTIKLRKIAENENETPKRQKKALKLFLIMTKRMMNVTQFAIKINTPKAPSNFEYGGKL